MVNVIVAFSKPEDARSIRNILVRNGFRVVAVCTSGAHALASTEELNCGIVISGYRLTDMLYEELRDCLAPRIDMLVVTSPNHIDGEMSSNVIKLPLPLKVHDLISTVEMMVEAQEHKRRNRRLHPKIRNSEEQRVIGEAKALLMERNGMSEDEAHKYIQKCSMDSGVNLVEMAQMVMSLIGE